MGLTTISGSVRTGVDFNKAKNIRLLFAKKGNEGIEILMGFSKKTAKRKGKMKFYSGSGRISHVVQHQSHLNI